MIVCIACWRDVKIFEKFIFFYFLYQWGCNIYTLNVCICICDNKKTSLWRYKLNTTTEISVFYLNYHANKRRRKKLFPFAVIDFLLDLPVIYKFPFNVRRTLTQFTV